MSTVSQVNRPVAPSAEANGGATGGGPVALVDYPAILREMGLLNPSSVEVGAALAQAAQAEPWSAVWAAFPSDEVDELSATHFRGYVADSPSKEYLLVVREGRMEVLYGWSVCRPLAVSGNRQAGLMGERRTRAGIEAQPKVWLAGTTMAQQDSAFEAVTVRPKSFQAIQGELGADPAPALVEAADVDGDDPPAEVELRKVLKVHPKLACLFMKGVPVAQAMALVAQVYHAVPADERHGLEPLLTYCRAAVTANAEDPPTSALQGNWTVQAVTDTGTLENWYLDLLSECAPRPTSVPIPEGNRDADTTAAKALSHLGDSVAGALSRSARHTPREYSFTEKETIAFFSNYEGPLEGTCDEILPPFWQAFKAERGKHSNCRLFLENQIRESFADGEMQYDFLVTTAMITDLKGLDFVGGDTNITYGLRGKGLSLYSLAPTLGDQDRSGTRAEFMAMEASSERLTATDRMKMNRLVASLCADTPSDRTDLACWVSFTVVFLRLLFTDECPALEPLKKILQALRRPMNWTGYQDEDFRTLAWAIHSGLRLFFLRNGSVALRRVLADIQSRVRPNRDSAPSELMTRRPPSHHTDGKQPGGRKRRGDDLGVPADTKITKTSYGFTKTLAAETNKGLDALRQANKKVTMKAYANGRDQIRTLFGPEFCGLCSREPCLAFFIRGKCEFRGCRMGHSLSSEPSDAVVAGILSRLQESTAKILASPPSF